MKQNKLLNRYVLPAIGICCAALLLSCGKNSAQSLAPSGESAAAPISSHSANGAAEYASLQEQLNKTKAEIDAMQAKRAELLGDETLQLNEKIYMQDSDGSVCLGGSGAPLDRETVKEFFASWMFPSELQGHAFAHAAVNLENNPYYEELSALPKDAPLGEKIIVTPEQSMVMRVGMAYGSTNQLLLAAYPVENNHENTLMTSSGSLQTLADGYSLYQRPTDKAAVLYWASGGWHYYLEAADETLLKDLATENIKTKFDFAG